MGNEKSPTTGKVKLFVPATFEGVTSAAIIESAIHDDIELETIYTRHLDFREYDRFQDADMIITLGLPYMGYNLPEEFYRLDVPFIDFIHICTYGDTIKGEYISSIVNEDQDPIVELTNYLKTNPESSILGKHSTLTEHCDMMVAAVNDYRTWNWENNGVTRALLALYHASYKYMPRLVKGRDLKSIIKEYAPIIKAQLEKMKDYIDRKKQTVKTCDVEVDGVTCLLKVAFAEEYINEMANELLQEQTDKPVIVCVGRTTKGNDMFSIRTRNVHAGKVAALINEGKGKDVVGTVFSTTSYTKLMGTVIQVSIEESQTS